MSVNTLPNSGLGWDFRQCPNAPIPGAIGGYEYSGVQYLFFYQGSEFGAGDLRIHALKSTDMGVTWTDTGNINIPPVVAGPPNAVPTYTTCMDGNIVYLMAIDIDGTGLTSADQTTGPILLWKYDLTANSFDAGGPLSGAPTVWKGWSGASYPLRSGICLHLLRRGPGDMLLLYTGVETIGANKYTRIYVATFNGTSCGSGSVLPGQAGTTDAMIERCAGCDASHNLHVILSRWQDFHFWYHIAMDSGGSFGTFQTIETNAYFQNDTSNLLDFMAAADTIAFLGVRNRSSSGDNGDLAIYSAPGGSLTPTWTFNNLPSTANPVQDPVIAPDWIGALAYLDGTLHAFWTQTGVPPGWNISGKMGEIRGSTASASDLTTWTAETSIMGPFDAGAVHWGAGQVAVWQGPGIGLGVLGNFEGYDDGGTGDPIETSRMIAVPPAGGAGIGVTCGSPPSGKVGVAYSHTFPAMGGTPPYVYTITTSILPPGLLLTTGSGNISGIPTFAGDFPITVTVTDAADATGSANCSIHIDLDLECNNPPNGSVGATYSHPMAITGATPPYTFTITAGGLPPGLTIDTSGNIFGTPTTAGIYGFQVNVVDHIGNTGHVACSIKVLVGISCNSPPDGKLGDAYLHSLTVSGAPVGSTLAITSGALPPGLTIDSTGTISGTPTLAGSYSFVVTVTAPSIGSSEVGCTMGVGYGTLQTSCGTPPVATVGFPGSIYRPPVIMGTASLPPQYDLNGTLLWTFPIIPPPGFHWDDDPGSPTYGHLVGTPTQAGTFDFTYTVSSPDGQSVTNTCPFVVQPAGPGGGPFSTASCSITITPQPNTGGPGGTPCPDDTIGGPG